MNTRLSDAIDMAVAEAAEYYSIEFLNRALAKLVEFGSPRIEETEDSSSIYGYKTCKIIDDTDEDNMVHLSSGYYGDGHTLRSKRQKMLALAQALIAEATGAETGAYAIRGLV